MGVLSRVAEGRRGGPENEQGHEPFIDSLIERLAVLFGGSFAETPTSGFEAAYVLRCDGLAEAQEIVADDPLVTSGASVPTVVRWDLVGVDTAAIEPQLGL